MTITLPIPDKRLSPNARTHWRKKSQITRLHRTRARLLTLAAGVTPAAYLYRLYSLQFYFPDARRRDDDNAAASCKAYRDGIADALLIDDHALSMAAAPQMLIDRQNPRLEITLS